MRLIFQSFMFGIAFELLLVLVLVCGLATSSGDVPNGLVVAVLAAHFPADYVVGRFVFPINILLSFILTVIIWTGVILGIRFMSKKLVARKHDDVFN